MFGSTQLMAEDPLRLDGAGDNYSIFGIAWRGGFGGAASLVISDREVFSPCAAAALYGGFAEHFFCYLEDVDLGFRLRLGGHGMVQVADARVRHVGSAISGRHSSFTLYHSTRNGIFLLIRCMPLALMVLALPLYIVAQLWLMTRTTGWRHRLRGLRDGLGAVKAAWTQRGAIPR
ncbi:MAG: glycosyltransferase family 2 protein, partial [Rhodospirillaceae bacterium]|nr:glycosyltransferase family 2 protein [Rhodospirillaceae bacterium]